MWHAANVVDKQRNEPWHGEEGESVSKWKHFEEIPLIIWGKQKRESDWLDNIRSLLSYHEKQIPWLGALDEKLIVPNQKKYYYLSIKT